jgi:hypothetical protein
MNRLIRVFEPSSDELDSQFTRRLDFFTGRHLGNQEFRLEQMYRDDRLRWLMEGRRAGIVHGLEIDVPPEMEDATSLNPLGRFRIRPGMGFGERGLVLTLSLPLPVAWNELLTDWKDITKQALPDGLYLVDIAREEQEVDPQTPSDPCRRDEPDALRDERIEWVAQAHLRGPLTGIGSVVGQDSWLVANRCAARLLGHSFTDREIYTVVSVEHSQQLVATGVVVAVCAIVSGKPLWIDQTPVRRTLKQNADARALLNQTVECLRSVIAENPMTGEVNAWAKSLITNGKLPLEWLPAAGELPSELLIYPKDAIEKERKPWCPLFRSSIGLDLIPIRASAAQGLIEQEISRGPIHLSGNDRVRLLVAVADQDFRPDLLDVPPPDFALIDDFNRAYVTAYQSWLSFRAGYIALYGIASPNLNDPLRVVSITKEFTAADEGQVTSRPLKLSRDGLSALGITWTTKDNALLLNDQATAPDSPDKIRADIIARKLIELNPSDGRMGLPEPYDNDFEDIRYNKFEQWKAATNLTFMEVPFPPVANTNANLIELPLTQQYIDWLDEQVGKRTSTVDTLRDLILALRHKLDGHTLNLASISGGIATDGSGMRLARWSPYVAFTGKTAVSAPTTPPPTTGGSAIANTVGTAPRQTEFRMIAASVPSFTERVTKQVQPITKVNNLKAVAIEGIFQRTPFFSAKNETLSLPKDASPISPPGYNTPDESFGVISNVSPEVYALEELDRGLNALATTINTLINRSDFTLSFTPNLAPGSQLLGITFPSKLVDALDQTVQEIRELGKNRDAGTTALNKYLTKINLNLNLTAQEKTAIVDALQADGKTAATLLTEVQNAATGSVLSPLQASLQGVVAPRLSKATTTALRYEWMMSQGRKLVEGIAKVEAERRRFEEILRAFIVERDAQAERMVTLRESLPALRSAYEEARQAWNEASRDYAMAQSELIRDWEAVELRDAERTRILMQPRGLFYVRTRSIALSQTLADPLPLARKDADDVIPGCDSHHDLPSEMDDFLDAVWEVPVADFTALRPWLPALPDRMRIALWLDRRDQRLQTKSNIFFSITAASTSGIVRTKLAPLAEQNRAMYRTQIGNRARFSDSLREFQREAAQVLSLTDVLSGQRGDLRSAGERLRDQYEQVIGCLVAQLESSLPSLRYEWAQAAEDDRLPVEDPEQWHGLDRLADRSFLTARTLVETVRWMFAQLSNEGSGTGRTALRNLVRAAVIAIAHGDPSAHIRGPVVSAPAQLRPGSLLRVALNREALPGTRLHLFDQDHRLVGEVQVDDHDAQGAVVSLISSTSSTLSISTRFSVMQIKNK